MTGNLLIRPLETFEYETVIALWMMSYLSIGQAHPNDELRQEFRVKFTNEIANNWDLFVADMEGEIVGMLALKRSESKLDQIFVHPDYLRNGIGKRLMEFAKQRLPSGMWLKTDKRNKKANCFYESEGFVRRVAQTEQSQNDVHYVWTP